MPTTMATVHTDALPGGDRLPRCQLVVIEGPDRGRAAALGPSELSVGTDEDCGLVLTDDRVSRRHLAVCAERGGFDVRDLGSTNGTLYEGSLLTAARVPAGATFKLGRSFVRIQPQLQALDVPPSTARRFAELVGESLAMREVFAALELAARSEVTVLLEGETGTGKELAARGLHEQGARRKGPFVAVDCGALPESLLESELFGHVRGAFTGASGGREGAFARASGGTIFLDELGAISSAVQARLLRVLEERRVRPVGSDQERPVDVRVVAASRDDLDARVADGSFRPDLYYRINVLRVRLPPLRARREDIPAVARALLRARGFEPGALEGANLERLRVHDWPGNVRELRNALDRALALSPTAQSFAELTVAVGPSAATDDGSEALRVRTELSFAEAKARVVQAFEARYLRELLARERGNVSAAARAAGLDRKHLRELLKRHGITPREGEALTPRPAPPRR